ncbi:unnamed protein product [Pseudo-nitzschia multistriata]|uniref:CAAX prenyl protease 2/Lysostaphin resistance protein A-like domain-containing protein n=1 Tax=Pseudo-nitzschia multistriata TaxID=183589 RepID=A0A448ZSL9_9STRA|nr:unnamed protein product [Pseudo-nitzschia multistriata]
MMPVSRSKKSSAGRAATALSLSLLLSCGSLALAFTTTTPGSQCAFHHPVRLQHPTKNVPFVSDSTVASLGLPTLPPQKFRGARTIASGSGDETNNETTDDKLFDFKTTIALVGGQSLLIVVAAIAAKFVGTPNFGLGPNIDFGLAAIGKGILWSLPLGALAVALDFVEDRFQALQDVTKATQSSVLSLLGGTFKPVLGGLTALALGIAAGFGEEMLFRGVLQADLASRTASEVVAVGLSSVIFGALHAVTPLYAILATLASVFFGWLYLATGNLAVPIATHAFYDWAALLYAHWTVTNMSESEQQSLLAWRYGSGDES